MDGDLAAGRFACKSPTPEKSMEGFFRARRLSSTEICLRLPDTEKKSVEEIRQKNFALGLFRKLPLLQVMQTD